MPDKIELTDRGLLHPVFGHFARYRGPGRPGFIAFDFLATFVREDYIAAKANNAPYIWTDYPPAAEDVFAWIDVLQAVVDARETFRMMELGSAYGCWAARGALAARQLGLDVELTCVEAEPEHFRWIGGHMADNAIPTSSVRKIHAALSDQPGKMLFYVQSAWIENSNARNWHGQELAHSYDEVTGVEGTYDGYPLLTMKTGCRAIEVPVITLEEVLEGAGIIDVIHADLQDAELRTFSTGMDAMDRQVKRVNIGTHSVRSEEGLRALFTTHGWESLADYSLNGNRETPYGTLHFQDGVQSWRNSRLAGVCHR